VHIQIAFTVWEAPFIVFLAWKLFTVTHAIDNTTLHRTIQNQTEHTLPPHFVLTFCFAISSIPELQTQPSFLCIVQTSQQIPQAATCSMTKITKCDLVGLSLFMFRHPLPPASVKDFYAKSSGLDDRLNQYALNRFKSLLMQSECAFAETISCSSGNFNLLVAQVLQLPQFPSHLENLLDSSRPFRY